MFHHLDVILGWGAELQSKIMHRELGRWWAKTIKHSKSYVVKERLISLQGRLIPPRAYELLLTLHLFGEGIKKQLRKLTSLRPILKISGRSMAPKP